VETAALENSICLPNNTSLLVAFSGGPDSTALLAAVSEIAKQCSLQVHACHINHSLRGDESDEDENFCRELCKQWNIPLHVRKVQTNNKSENDLRDLRYQQLAEVAGELGAKICLTGHTLDDQIETMLFRLFRGTGPSGLLGIPVCRRLSDKLFVLRPLLSLNRSDCQDFLDRRGVKARTDSSNKEDIYSRNFIRNKILPLAESRFSCLKQHLEQLRKVMEADEALLSCLSKDAALELSENSYLPDTWHVDQFNELPLSLRRRVLHQSLLQRKIECDFDRIESMLEMIDQDGDSAITLNQCWELRISSGEIKWVNLLDLSPDIEEIEELSVPVQAEGLTFIHKLGLAIKMEKLDSQTDSITLPGSHEHEMVGDLSTVGPLMIRLRKAGDQIQPLGMKCMVRLKKFLHTHKTGRTLTFGGRALVLANDCEVLWVPGCGLSQRIAVSSKATHRISVMVLSPDDNAIC
jgi:tRNA(Ile)-lysidine synthase